MILLTAALAAQLLAGVSAIMLARRRSSHVPAAVGLTLFAAVGIAHFPILAAIRPMPRPFEGSGLVLLYLDGAVTLAQYAIVAGLAVAVAVASLAPKQLRCAAAVVVGVWLAASVLLGAAYPSPLVRGEGLQRVYFDVDLICLFVATIALTVEARADIAAKRSPHAASMVAFMLVLADGALLVAPFTPWRNALFSADFGPIQLFIVLLFATITIAQVALWQFTSPA